MKIKREKEKQSLPSWKSKTKYEKTLFIIAIILCISILAFSLLAGFSTFVYAEVISEILLVCLFIIEALMYYKYDKWIFKSAIVCSVIIIICLLINLLI